MPQSNTSTTAAHNGSVTGLENNFAIRQQLRTKKLSLSAKRLKDFMADTGPASMASSAYGGTTVEVARGRLATKLDNFDRAFNHTGDTTSHKNN